MATVKIEIPDEQVAALTTKATSAGLTLEKWFQKLAEVEMPDEQNKRNKAQAATARMLELQKHVKPDPEGWTTRDYVNYGRR